MLVGIDQITKAWAVGNLAGGDAVNFIKIGGAEIINLTYVENNGAVFGILRGQRVLFIVLTAVLLAVCCVYVAKTYKKNPKILTVGLTLIVSGGIGNLIDRIFRSGLVVDFIDFGFVNFYTFNFADCCVVVGTIILSAVILFSKEEETAKTAKKVRKPKKVKS